MIKADRICVYIFIFGLLFLIPSIWYVKFIDELCVLLFGLLAILDCVVNGNWKKYKLMWIGMAVMSFYAVYSIVAFNYNTIPYILMDWIIELKPYIPFFVMLGISPKLTALDKTLIRKICLVNATIAALSFLGGYELVRLVVFHVSYAGIVIFLSAIFYIFASIDEFGKVDKRTLIMWTCYMIAGLACTRSKYYGHFVLFLFFMYIYKPGMLRHFSLGGVLVVFMVLAAVLAVGWNKFSYYYLTGGSDKFDPTVVESFARPVLFATGGLIFMDHFPFGSGLASFATYPSQISYSGIYAEYGIDTVFGLSPQRPDFICDAFFPSLAQFGVVGLILFIWFWVYVYSYLRSLVRYGGEAIKYEFGIGSLIICFILIESTSGNSFTQSVGMVAMCLLGIICSKGRDLKQESMKDDVSNLVICKKKI